MVSMTWYSQTIPRGRVRLDSDMLDATVPLQRTEQDEWTVACLLPLVQLKQSTPICSQRDRCYGAHQALSILTTPAGHARFV